MEDIPVQPQRKRRPIFLLLVGTQLVTLLIVAYLAFQILQLKTQLTTASLTPTYSNETTQVSGQPQATLPPAYPTDWLSYSNSEYAYSFSHPARYSQVTSAYEAQPSGQVSFSSGSKSDLFGVDAVLFSGSVDQFIQKYTEFDSGVNATVANLNFVTVLGDLQNQSGSKGYRLYKYVHRYDQSVNPGAQDVISYTAFLVSGKHGYIFRSSSVVDNLAEFSQILSSVKYTR